MKFRGGFRDLDRVGDHGDGTFPDMTNAVVVATIALVSPGAEELQAELRDIGAGQRINNAVGRRCCSYRSTRYGHGPPATGPGRYARMPAPSGR